MDILESESVNKVNKVMKRDVLGNMAPSKGMLGSDVDMGGGVSGRILNG